jgi:ribonucleoside-diphosphate reductase alpha chain
VEIHPLFRAVAQARGFWSDALAATLARRGRVRGLDEVPADVQALFATAHDLAPETHVRMQAVFQRHMHAAVSKTVNFPQAATPEEVGRVYRLAYDLGCKGVTVYRDRSRAEQVLAFGDAADERVGAAERCPECGGELSGERGCAACRQCGWSKCT